MTQGKFIVIEGIDGSGTTTQSKLLVEWLLHRGISALWTYEPSQGPIGSLLRQVLTGRVVVWGSDGAAQSIHNDVISLLFAADRLDHLDNLVYPALQDGRVVVSDRYYHSSYTYQALEGNIDWILTLNARAREPEITYILDLPPEQAEARRRQAGREAEELYELLSKQIQIRRAYLQLQSRLEGQKIVVIDADQGIKTVHHLITEDLKARFGWS